MLWKDRQMHGCRAPTTFKLEGEVTSLSESSQGEVGDNREKWGDFWERLIAINRKTLFCDPSDVTLPKFSQVKKLSELICSGFFLFITTLRTSIQCHIFISVYLDYWSLAYQ
jgi:hypothetical protein